MEYSTAVQKNEGTHMHQNRNENAVLNEKASYAMIWRVYTNFINFNLYKLYTV